MGRKFAKSVGIALVGAVMLYNVLELAPRTTPAEFVEDNGSGSIEAVLPDDGDEEAFFYGEHFDTDERGDEVIITLDQHVARNI